MTTTVIDRLAAHATLGSAPREELAWLAAHGTLQEFPENAVVAAKGARVDTMFVIFSGEIATFIDRGGGPKKVMAATAGEMGGLLPFSRLSIAPGDSVAVAPTTVLAVDRDVLRRMTCECYGITEILVHSMLDRARVFVSSDLHDEKLVSLGKLSAGLAHELNNPAAAIERGAANLEDRLVAFEGAARRLGEAHLGPAQFEAVDAVRQACGASRARGVLSPLEQAEREEGLIEWLAGHGLDAELAGSLADTPVTVAALDRIATAVPDDCLACALEFAATGSAMRAIASEIQDAAVRISGLVTAIKGFTHMDQGQSAQPVDLGAALDNTVAVLRSKARARSMAISVSVADGVPHVRGFAGELNQIFANLIDNALDAAPDGGRVEISVGREHDRVVVRVVDNGPGIPPEIQPHIFDPFFTTKKVGEGMGLGLDIARRLATHNDGAIEMSSRPGRTEFRVRLPIAGGPGA